MKLLKGSQEYFDGEPVERKKVIASSLVMKEIFQRVKGLRPDCAPILILGENGTGKKFMAQTIFNFYPGDQSFLSLKCYDLSSEQILIHLFGGEGREGLLQKAQGQTLFIEGVDTLSGQLQDRLLAFFKSAQGNRFLKTTRLVSSAGSELPGKTAKREFSEELFSVLNKNLIFLPSLKERVEDIPEFLSYFLTQNGFKGCVSEEALSMLKSHSWSGNIIELKNLCIRWSFLHENKQITERDLPEYIKASIRNLSCFIKYNPEIKLEAVINFYISQAMRHFSSKKEAGRALGISPKTIYNKLEKMRM